MTKNEARIIEMSNTENIIAHVAEAFIPDPDFYVGMQKMILFCRELNNIALSINGLQDTVNEDISEVISSFDMKYTQDRVKELFFKSAVFSISNSVDYMNILHKQYRCSGDKETVCPVLYTAAPQFRCGVSH